MEECTACGKQHSILAGTILEQTKSDQARWFLAIYLVTSSEGGISATELQRQMGLPGSQRRPRWSARSGKGSYGRLGRGGARSGAPWSRQAASPSVTGSRPMRPRSAARGPASPAAALRARPWSPARSRAGAAGRMAGSGAWPARPPAAAGSPRRLGQQPGRRSRPERLEPRPSRHRRLVGLSRPRGRGLRPRADPARPALGRRRAPPAAHPPRLRARQAPAPGQSAAQLDGKFVLTTNDSRWPTSRSATRACGSLRPASAS